MSDQIKISKNKYIGSMLAFLLTGALITGVPLSIESYNRYERAYDLETQLSETKRQLKESEVANISANSDHDSLREKYNNLATKHNYLANELSVRGNYGPALQQVKCLNGVLDLEIDCSQ